MFRNAAGSPTPACQLDSFVSSLPCSPARNNTTYPSCNPALRPAPPSHKAITKLRGHSKYSHLDFRRLQSSSRTGASVLIRATFDKGTALEDESTTAGVSDIVPKEDSLTGTTAQSHLDLLERLTLQGTGRDKGVSMKSPAELTIAEQLSMKVGDGSAEVTVPLGKKKELEYNSLTISQKRNIRRQQYLDQVAKRNDVPFFAALALFIVVPPAVILGVAVGTGYIDLLP